MQSKSLLIAVAAFAVTATGVQAYNGMNLLDKAGFNSDQAEAVQAAQELRATGDFLAARDKLLSAGITEDDLHSLHEVRKEAKEAFKTAVEEGDFTAFKIVIAESPLADIIISEEDFEQFRAAHDLRQAGEWEEAREIMDELGVDFPHHEGKKMGKISHANLTDIQREAIRTARAANDRETVRAVLNEAGIEGRPHHNMGW